LFSIWASGPTARRDGLQHDGIGADIAVAGAGVPLAQALDLVALLVIESTIWNAPHHILASIAQTKRG
jgi:hypothetical protein